MKPLFTLIPILVAAPVLADDYDAYRVPCSSGQLDTVTTAINDAKTLLAKGVASIPAMESATGQTFKRWFGGNEGDSDEVVKAVYQDLQLRLAFTSFWCPLPANFPGEAAIFDGEPRHPSTFAWVPAKSQTEIFLEQKFFTESATTGEDSQAGTLIHELSHNSTVANIVDTDVDGKKDANGKKHPDYGKANAMILASTRPLEARRTADNLQYYVEDLVWGIP